MDFDKVKKIINEFSAERDWDKFHTPKNLVMAVSSEVGELVDIFQWLDANESKIENISEKDLSKAKEEIADILIYLIRLSEKLNIDLEEAVLSKIKLNNKKYPVNISKGNSTKYNRRDE